MRGPHSKSGGRALLFDRLVDFDPASQQESPVFQNYTKEQLLLSVQKELADFLNCRCKHTFAEYKKEAEIPYGVPDMYGLLADSTLHKGGKSTADKVCGYIKKAIEIFEPRLTNVNVVSKKVHTKFGYTVEVSGDLLISNKVERFYFPIDVDSQSQDAASKQVEVYNAKGEALVWPAGTGDFGIDKA